MFKFEAFALNVVLATCEVPHEVAPVHEIHLIGQEEADVFQLRRHGNGHFVAVGRLHVAFIHFNVAHPLLILSSVTCAPHSREEHGEFGRIVHANGFFNFFILVGFIGRCLFFALGAHALLVFDGTGGVSLPLRAVCLTLEERIGTILFTSHVGAEGEDVFGRVLVHRRVLRGADDDDGVGRVANHQHQHAEQGGVEEAFAQDEVSVLVFQRQHKIESAEHEQAANHGERAMTHEGDTEQRDAGDIENLRANAVLLRGAPNGGKHHADEHDEIYHNTRVERHAEAVHKEEFKPASDFHDAGHDAVEHGRHQKHGNA